jgi:hypothetical protein
MQGRCCSFEIDACAVSCCWDGVLARIETDDASASQRQNKIEICRSLSTVKTYTNNDKNSGFLFISNADATY